MPQYPIPTVNLPVSGRRLNITAATLLKAAPGRLFSLQVLVAGSAPGTVNDCLTTGAAAVANQIAGLPNAVGRVDVNAAFATGLVVVPGTGQTVVAYYN